MALADWLSDADVRRGIAVTASIALTPALMRLLGKIAPPRNPVGYAVHALKPHYSKVEAASQFVAILSIWIALAVWLRLGGGDSFWLLAFGFGWMCLGPVLFVAIITALSRKLIWTEYWRYHECKHGVSMKFLGVVYFAGSLLGMVATVWLLLNR